MNNKLQVMFITGVPSSSSSVVVFFAQMNIMETVDKNPSKHK